MTEAQYQEIIKQQQKLISLLTDFSGINFRDTENHFETLSTKERNIGEFKCDLDGFIKYLKSEGISANSIDSYSYTIKEFFNKYEILNNENLSEYEKYLNKNWKPKTIKLRIAALNKYFKFVSYKGFEFKKVKEQKATFCDNAINEEQYEKLIKWAEQNNSKTWLICKVLAGTGVRVSELITLKTSDISKGYADIVGKGNKRRRIYFSKKLIEEIADKCGTEYVVENRYGKQITTRGVSEILKKSGVKAGIPKEVLHPHSFRHYFAKQFLKQKNDITLLGDLLGHSNIATTAIYTRMTSEEQRKELDEIVVW